MREPRFKELEGERGSIKLFLVDTTAPLSRRFAFDEPFKIIFYPLLSITDKPPAKLQSSPENEGAGRALMFEPRKVHLVVERRLFKLRCVPLHSRRADNRNSGFYNKSMTAR